MSLFSNRKKERRDPGSQSRTPMSSTTALARLVVSTIEEGFIVTDGQGTIKLINPAAVAMIGCKDEGFALGLSIDACVELERKDGTKLTDAPHPLLQIVTTGQNFATQDWVLVAKDNNKKRPVAIHVIPTGDAGTDVIITFRDISVEKEAADAQSEFISTASHEMRTPVASIEGYLGLALNPQTATIDERARGYLESAQNASRHLGRLFRNLLDVTKLDDGRAHLQLVPLELTDFMQKIADEYVPQFEKKHLSYTFGSNDSSLGLKRLRRPIYVAADVDFLREIAANLIENAIKYTLDGGQVQVEVYSDEGRAIFAVSDSGIGIASEDLEHIFQKFYRVDNSQTREIGGTGLGLYLVKKRAEAMGGNVWAESVYGRGSTFAVALPLLSEAEFERRKIAVQNDLLKQKAEHAAQIEVAGEQQANNLAKNTQKGL